VLAVRELLSDLDLRLVAGEAGLDRPVRWVHISELLDPTPWLSGGEVLLTTGLQLTDEDAQSAFVDRLADHELAGLGLGTGFALGSVPGPLAAAAARRELPLFEVPYEVPFIAVTERASARLVNEHYAVLQRAISAHERLERVVLEERGLDGVAGALAALVEGSALVLDAHGEPLAVGARRQAPGPHVLAALAAELGLRSAAGARRPFAPAGDLAGRALALPVSRDGAAADARVPAAWLVAARDDGPLTELHRLILHQAVTVVALELLRGRVAQQTERRLAGDVLRAALAGELTGTELAGRLRPFGLPGRLGAVVLQPERARTDAVQEALGAALGDAGAGGLVATVPAGAHAPPLVCALVPALSGDQEEAGLFALAERLRAAAGEELAAGAGRPVGGADARRSFHEARCALEALALGVQDPDAAPGRLGTYHGLGSFQLLLALQDDDALRLFCDSILGPIENGEGHYGGELMRSLEAFIECNGQWERAAARLFCHRHTLRYRIRRVEELTGRSLSSARDRIEFWLALRARELVQS